LTGVAKLNIENIIITVKGITPPILDQKLFPFETMLASVLRRTVKLGVMKSIQGRVAMRSAPSGLRMSAMSFATDENMGDRLSLDIGEDQ